MQQNTIDRSNRSLDRYRFSVEADDTERVMACCAAETPDLLMLTWRAVELSSNDSQRNVYDYAQREHQPCMHNASTQPHDH